MDIHGWLLQYDSRSAPATIGKQSCWCYSDRSFAVGQWLLWIEGCVRDASSSIQPSCTTIPQCRRHKGLSDRISVKEWRRGTVNEPGGWTYHSKGLWITLPNEQAPTISLVGSSNYTKRSYNLDLEANALIVTRDQDLMRRLGEEETWLQDYATKVGVDDFAKTERRVGFHVRIAMWLVTVLGGAL